jgi:hypothetical protein
MALLEFNLLSCFYSFISANVIAILTHDLFISAWLDVIIIITVGMIIYLHMVY